MRWALWYLLFSDSIFRVDDIDEQRQVVMSVLYSVLYISMLSWGLLATNPVVAVTNGSSQGQTGFMPDSLTYSEFFNIIQSISEPTGEFHSENFTSNESSYQHPLPVLRRMKVSGGAYLGVGPEQNFTYIGETKPSIAFILDIRRQNLLLHLLYKALFDLSETRMDFLAKLLSKPMYVDLPFYKRWIINRPTWHLSDLEPSISSLLGYFDDVDPDESLFDQNLVEIKERLGEYGVTSNRDIEIIEYIYRTFFERQIDIQYDLRSSDGSSIFPYPNLRDLLTETTTSGETACFLSKDETFYYVKDLHKRNLIIPVVGDFAGNKAIRGISEYIRSLGEVLSVFYTSNVEMYLCVDEFQRPGKCARYFDNISSLPVNDVSVLIRAYHNDHFTTVRYYPNFDPRSHPNRVGDHIFTTTVHYLSLFRKNTAWKKHKGLRRYYKLATKNIIE